jgi:N-acetylneuraminic acid mutarotase
MSRSLVLLLIALLIASSLAIVARPSYGAVTANSWSTKASMPQSELGIKAVAVNGLIYVMGSSFNLEYNPSNDSWTAKTPMPTPRDWFAIATYQNLIYVIGGRMSDTSYSTNEVYDTYSDSWKALKPMPTNISDIDANVVDGKIYVLSTTTEVYNIGQDSWTEKTPMPYPVDAYQSSVMDNKIYVIGGLDSSVSNKTQIYNAVSDSWSMGSSIPFAVYNAAATATTGIMSPKRIYVFGGQMADSTSTLEAVNVTQCYYPENDTWIVGASMPTARLGLACAVVDDKIFVFGGSTMAVFSPALNINEVYLPIGYGNPDPSFSSKSTVPEFPTIVIVPLFLSAFCVAVAVRHRKTLT